MIRFYDKQFMKIEDVNISIASECIEFGINTWNDGKDYFKNNLCNEIQLLPIINEKHETICYAYQDGEANRELRMLKELEKSKDVLSFQDIFPEIYDVIVCGCNELAYRFVQYLEKQQVNVIVTGKYWDKFGYRNNKNIDVDGANKLVIYAEGTIPKTDYLYQTIVRSASPEFECIDKIYEANVLKGKVKDTVGSFAQVLEKLKGKEIAILGTDTRAQDTYDFLYGQGIDICCFVEQKTLKQKVCKTLLGKEVVCVENIINNHSNMILINCIDKNSALGTESVEFFDYYGYERNKQLFLIRDYVEIPCSNLLHILKGKTVLLVGNEQLCTILSNYLKETEQGDIDVKYMQISQLHVDEETNILCTVNPWYGSVRMEDNPKLWGFKKELLAKNVISYTNYFSSVRAFVAIDFYMNRNVEKYSLKQLIPKGVLLGRIPAASGNIFFRGIIDGHPNILKWAYTQLNNNLFFYCIRLANEKSENIIRCFKKIYNEEFAFQSDADFTCWDKFEESMNELLSLKEHFTSQELFMAFHIAYIEMMYGHRITDISQKIIYWEPHNFPRDEFPFLAKWLENEQINGQTIFMCRDNIVWTGSRYKFYKEEPTSLGIIQGMSMREMIETDNSSYRNWQEFQVRFEDIKLHPKEELMKICDRLEIPWSDTMLRTTQDGKTWDYEGISDFDLKPVFNKYTEYLSEFDRFRIALISSPYQKKYGYSYENCLQFSRKELQEMFLKEFRFQQKLQFTQKKDRTMYYFNTYKSLQKQLWETHKHMVKNDIIPQFGEVEIGKSIEKKQLKNIENQGELEKLIEFVKQQNKLILYGIGRDCKSLLEHLDEKQQAKILFSDLKAAYTEVVFYGKKVLAPKELCENYQEYKILITSSWYYKSIWRQLKDLGINPNRIICNKTQLWKEEK